MPHFNHFVHAGLQLVQDLPGAPDRFDDDPVARGAQVRVFEVRRLAVLKQIVTMMLAVSPWPEFGKAHPALSAFVLNRDQTGLPDRYRFFLSLNLGPLSRSLGLSLHIDLRTGASTPVSEVVYFPFAYLMTIDAPVLDAPLWSSLGEITGFANVPYEDTADVALALPIGFAHTPYPGDYRSAAAMRQERESPG